MITVGYNSENVVYGTTDGSCTCTDYVFLTYGKNHGKKEYCFFRKQIVYSNHLCEQCLTYA